VFDAGDKAKIVALLDYQGSGLNIVRTASRLMETDSMRAEIQRGESILVDGRL
jgi:hypothetical protein